MDGSARKHFERWRDAGLIDAATAERIRAWEAAQPSTTHGRLGAIAFGLGGLSLGAGILLFVAAHWDSLAPGSRFGLVLALVATFHLAGAATAARLPALAMTLHAVGTAALGAGIFLAGQIFNLGGNWPAAMLLWSVGAAAGIALLGDWPQVLWTALLVPGWLIGEWVRLFEHREPPPGSATVLSVGLTLLALAYLAAPTAEADQAWRRALARLGMIALIPVVSMVGFAATNGAGALLPPLAAPYPVGWAVALGLPLGLALWLRGPRGAWLAIAVPWVLLLRAAHGSAAPGVLPYLLDALGAIGLVVFGVRDRRSGVVNLGIAAFGLTVGAFYFSSVFDRLGRAAGLAGLGLTFLVGGWALERVRRLLIARIRGPES